MKLTEAEMRMVFQIESTNQNAALNEIYMTSVSYTHLDVYKRQVQAIVHEWQQYISEHFYECNKQILSN